MPDIRRRAERGQILPLFAIVLLALVLMASLLIDGSWALLTRRQYQDAADAAALAGANVLQGTTGCNANLTAVTTAVKASVAANLPGYDPSKIIIKCRTDWQDFGVEVDLNAKSPGFFSAVAGYNGFDIGTHAMAVNGASMDAHWSVVLLDPNQCSSLLFSGGPTVTFDGAARANSSCKPPAGYAIDQNSNGGAAQLTFNNGAGLYTTGAVGSIITTPPDAPMVGNLKPLPDPLGWEVEPIVRFTSFLSSVKVPYQSNNKLVLNGTTQVLKPGLYRGGIQLKSSAIALLEPGVYVLMGGGLDIGAQASVMAVKHGQTTPPTGVDDNAKKLDWETNVCPDGQCGVLIFNTGTAAAGTNQMGPITMGGGAGLMLRPYNPNADYTAFWNPGMITNYTGAAQYSAQPDWTNILLWQSANYYDTLAAPTTSPMTLAGGGLMWMKGGIYGPTCQVTFKGGSGGSGGTGTSLDLTIQFITYDLQLNGNSQFHFFYQSNAFPTPKAYGLIE